MGRARSAPWTTTATFYVSSHATERIRERSEAALYLDDSNLRRAIDDAVVRAMKTSANVREVVDRGTGEDAKLVYVGADAVDGITLSGDVYALIKRNARGSAEFAIVTVLTESMVEKMYPTEPVVVGTSLGDKLRGAEVMLRETAKKPKPKATEKAPPKPVSSEFYLAIDDERVVYRGDRKGLLEFIEASVTDVEYVRCSPIRVRRSIQLEEVFD